MKKTFLKIALGALLIVPLALAIPAGAATEPYFDTTGSYVIDMEYLSVDYAHDVTLTQNSVGDLTGNGGYPAGGPHTYTWVITSGSVSGNTIEFTADYTATADAVTPQTTLEVDGIIAPDGTMSGTWSDNYQGGTRAGTWNSATGTAVLLGSLAAEDFGVVDYDTGLGQLSGYTAGFGLTDATLASSTFVVVKLYSGPTESDLLQTNTAIIPKFNADITGTQFSSPFDVSGTFDYVTDGYWTNVRESEYGQSVTAIRVVATVTLANGKVVTAENTNLTGDPTTIYPAPNTAPVLSNVPASPVSIPELSLYTFDANASDSDLPAQTLTFSLSGAPTGAAIASSTGVFTWTPTEAQGPGSYTFSVVVSDGSLTDSESITINVTEVTDPVPPTPVAKDACKNGGWKTFTNPSFKNQGQCVSYTNKN